MMLRFHTQFSEKNLTSHAGFVHLGRFAEKLNLTKMLNQHITIKRGKNGSAKSTLIWIQQ
jgi:predicted ATPase